MSADDTQKAIKTGVIQPGRSTVNSVNLYQDIKWVNRESGTAHRRIRKIRAPETPQERFNGTDPGFGMARTGRAFSSPGWRISHTLKLSLTRRKSCGRPTIVIVVGVIVRINGDHAILDQHLVDYDDHPELYRRYGVNSGTRWERRLCRCCGYRFDIGMAPPVISPRNHHLASGVFNRVVNMSPVRRTMQGAGLSGRPKQYFLKSRPHGSRGRVDCTTCSFVVALI